MNVAAFLHTECAGYDEVMSGNLLDNLDVFYGELTPARAVVYARLERTDKDDELTLQGEVRGPTRVPDMRDQKTLPSKYRMRYLGADPNQLAAAVIPDPCYWHSNLGIVNLYHGFEETQIYEVMVELCRHGHAIERTSRRVALRPLGVKGKFFSYASKTWILRGAHAKSSGFGILMTSELPSPLVRWNNCLLILDLTEGDAKYQFAACKAIAQAPVYAAVVFPADQTEIPDSIRYHFPNLLLGRWLRQGEELRDLSNTDFLVANVLEVARFADWAGSLPLPVVAVRALWTRVDWWAPPLPYPYPNLLHEIDRLQRDLAPYGQFAGYIV